MNFGRLFADDGTKGVLYMYNVPEYLPPHSVREVNDLTAWHSTSCSDTQCSCFLSAIS